MPRCGLPCCGANDDTLSKKVPEALVAGLYYTRLLVIAYLAALAREDAAAHPARGDRRLTHDSTRATVAHHSSRAVKPINSRPATGRPTDPLQR